MFAEVLARKGWKASPAVLAEASKVDHPLDRALFLALRLAGVGRGETLEAWRETMQEEVRRRLFPERFGEGQPKTVQVGDRFLPLAEAAIAHLVNLEPGSVSALLPFEPLTEEELQRWPSGEDYARLLAHMTHEGFRVCLAMAQYWRGLTIQDHVLGVTGLALWMGRQLSKTIPVDLPLLHGGAIGHDAGKFACVGDEAKRIPRLHYHYTHQYYATRGLHGLGHVATNHSCWDLERIRLPIEIQLLIYADFRVKDVKGADGRWRMTVISLKEAFDTILDKLENVDQAKFDRYQKVYRKLRDLEDYALTLGVDLDPPGVARSRRPSPYLPPGLDMAAVLAGRQRPDMVAMATGAQVPATVRLFAEAHTLGVLERLRDLPSLRALLESARSLKGWRDLRTLLGILGDYAPALSQEQKDLAIDFLWELLRHKDDDIRYQAGCRIADILALGDEAWSKDLPDGMEPQEADWMLTRVGRVLDLLDLATADSEEDMGPTEKVCYAIPIFLRRFFHCADPAVAARTHPFVVARLLARQGDSRPLVGLYTCESFELLIDRLQVDELERLPALAMGWAFHAEPPTRLMAWRLLAQLARRSREYTSLQAPLREATLRLEETLSRSTRVAELHVLWGMAQDLGLEALVQHCTELRETDRTPRREVSLRNLKAQVDWVEKKSNCDYLLWCVKDRQTTGRDREGTFANEIAFHLANILKVSRVEGARFHAGRCLLRLLPILSDTQRNDLSVELLRSLQLEGEAVARYIPRFLGPVLASLPAQELEEIVADLEGEARRGSETLQRLLLQTTTWLLLSLDPDTLSTILRRRLLGILLGALADTRPSTVHEGFALFAMLLDRLMDRPQDPRLTPLLELATRKFLTLITHAEGDEGRLFLIAQALSGLDKALETTTPAPVFLQKPRTGFLPGTFDPFTSAHENVVRRALAHCDEVWVQVDDFSWRKHAQPRNTRLELTWMALAGLPEAFLSPLAPPVNLAHEESLRGLERRMGLRSLQLIIGSDVVAAASAYKDPDAHIFSISHLMPVREGEGQVPPEELMAHFKGGLQVFRVASRVRSVSSTSLRKAFDQREDLEAYCDPLVARTLKERRLYVNYPARKEEIFRSQWALESRSDIRCLPDTLRAVSRIEGLQTASRWAGSPGGCLVLRSTHTDRDLAAITWQEAASAALPVLLSDAGIAQADGIPLHGRGALVEGIAIAPEDARPSHLDYLLCQSMGRWLDAGLLYALVGVPPSDDGSLWNVLRRHGAGWLDAAPGPGGERWAALNLSSPLVVLHDLEQLLQPQYYRHPRIREALRRFRRSMAGFFADRSPGSALLHIPEMETKRELAGSVESRQASGNGYVVLGMGRQFSRDTVQDRPTLALDLERYLTWQGYEAGLHPVFGSPDLDMQLYTARELGRQALLLVPFLMTPEPVLQVVEACQRVKIRLREVRIGFTSAAVHATLQQAGVPHHIGSVVPRWRTVLRESSLVPFVGGWSILGRRPVLGNLTKSLNDCLPYHDPHPLGLEHQDALDFSRMALEQGVQLFEALESVYREQEGRLLTLQDLGTVVRRPRCPPFPRGFLPPKDAFPSQIIAEDLQALARLLPEGHHAHREGWGRD